ncbi:MAG: rhodanese-like domain-containing protein [Alphaproteobacteria bacterium]|jgi:thiosulfate/3-mercaptopyruvate sulfurtransferase
MDVASRGYANPDLLWTPKTLQERQGQSGLTIIDTRPAERFAKGRIPGARHFDLYFVNTNDTDPAPLESLTRMWANMLGWQGVQDTDTIVFSGEFTDMCVARGFWLAEYLDHADVHVLDGGIAARLAAGLAVETGSDAPKPVKFEFKPNAKTVATYSCVLDAIDDPNCVIVDNRGRDEFVGMNKRTRHGGAIPAFTHFDGCNRGNAPGAALPEAPCTDSGCRFIDHITYCYYGINKGNSPTFWI